MPGQPNYAKFAQLGLGYLYSAISDTSDPNRRYFGSVIVPAAKHAGTNLLATAIQSFEIITRFKGEKSLYDFSRQQKAKAMERTCQLLCLPAGRPLTCSFHWFTGFWVAVLLFPLSKCFCSVFRFFLSLFI
jgi:hypothetical protein